MKAHHERLPGRRETAVLLADVDVQRRRDRTVNLVKTGSRARVKRVNTYAPLILAQEGRETQGDVRATPNTPEYLTVGEIVVMDGWHYEVLAVCHKCSPFGWTELGSVVVFADSPDAPRGARRLSWPCKHTSAKAVAASAATRETRNAGVAFHGIDHTVEVQTWRDGQWTTRSYEIDDLFVEVVRPQVEPVVVEAGIRPGDVITLAIGDDRPIVTMGERGQVSGDGDVCSPDSPIGAALLGREIGDTVTWTAPTGKTVRAIVVWVD